MSRNHTQGELETSIRELTAPLNGQLPRPWMTDLKDPESARVFVVGRNQRHGFDARLVPHSRHIDALFNRNGESCRNLYDEVTGSVPSPTRLNTDRFRSILQAEGVSDVLETNVICYSSPMSHDLTLNVHQGGRERGTEIFRTILHLIQPCVLIAHGAETIKDLSNVLDKPMPRARTEPGPPVCVNVDAMQIYLIRSLASPEWNKWSSWSLPHLKLVAKAVARAL